MSYKGIILSGGSSTRLRPITLGCSKQLLPIYDKPMIYYPLTTLMLAGIREILLITTPLDIDIYKRVLGDGSNFGISIDYKIQDKPRGLADAFIIGQDFISQSKVAMILGDNIFYSNNFESLLLNATASQFKAAIFGYETQDPNRFGVIEFDSLGNVLSIEEKPIAPKSNYAVTGLYFYDSDVVDYAKNLKPSHRNELEITDLNNIYLSEKKLSVVKFNKDFRWFDTGTYDSLLEAANFIFKTQKEENKIIGCPEEVAYKKQWISAEEIDKKISHLDNCGYGHYLRKIIS